MQIKAESDTLWHFYVAGSSLTWSAAMGYLVMLTNHSTTACWVWAKPGEAAGVVAVSQCLCTWGMPQAQLDSSQKDGDTVRNH